ncbi:MAG TPA: hypothetical protein GX505_09120 [Clostridiales bacterium]|nr:hypothetical protein [Clostridiales bacterium]
MAQRAFRNFYWGFLFVMIDFRINGFDILPDLIGYAFFVAGLNLLLERNNHFSQARTFNIIMLILSIFSIYERPAENTGGFNIHIDFIGLLTGIAALIFSLLAMYHLFMGIKQLAEEYDASDISAESEQRWKQFLYLQLAGFGVFLLILLPPLALVYLIVMLVISIALTVKFMGFMTRCGNRFSEI